MKNFVIAVFSILIFLVSLLAMLFGFMALIDPEKPTDSPSYFVFAIVAVVSFFISQFLWNLSKQK